MSRKTLRQNVVSRLQASAGVTALVPTAQIYDSRTTAIPLGKLPAIVVFCSRSRRVRDESSSALPLFKVTHAIGVDCFATGETDAELAGNVDDVADAVLAELLTSPTWVSQFEQIESANEEIVLEGGDDRRGLSRITFETRLSDFYDPITTDDLSTVDIDVDFIDPGGDDGEPDGDIDAELTIEDLET